MASAGTAGLVGVTAVTYQDQVKHGYQAMERTGRVASTLFLCINEYVLRGRRFIGNWTNCGD